MSNLDTLLDELSSYSVTPTVHRPTEPDLTEDQVTDFVVKSAGALVNAGLGSVNDLRDLVIQGQNPDEIAALASLISSTAGAIEALNKLTLLQKKNEASKELKQMEIQGKKEIAGMTSNNPTMIGNTITNNTNVLVASRDEIMKQFLIEPPTLSKEVILLNDNNDNTPQTPKETLEAIIANNT